jgi:hypothetical protein
MAFPCSYTIEVADRILDELLQGRTLREVCADDGMPAYGTVRQWVTQDRAGFAARYKRARQLGRAGLGRPTRYTAEIADRIVRQLSDGRTLTDICGDPGMPSCSTVRQWAMQDREGFAERYKRAREVGAPATGRPTLYSADLADWILDQLSDGRTLTKICGDRGMPNHTTVRLWANANREGFAARYHRAFAAGCDAMADQMIDIADDASGDWVTRRRPDGTTEHVADPGNIRRCAERIKARQRLLGKWLPKIYGRRPDPSAGNKPTSDLLELAKQLEERDRKLAKEWPLSQDRDSVGE